MQWENLSAPDFETARQSSESLCIVPMGVLESHGPHLPLGTDIFEAYTIAVEAAKLEPAVVFPAYYFGQLSGAQHIPGNICLDHDLLLKLLEKVCREIARNGFKKILLLNAHGGNQAFVQYFLQSTLHVKKDYTVYSMQAMTDDVLKQLCEDPDGMGAALSAKERKAVEQAEASGEAGAHAGMIETSFMLGVDRSKVHTDRMYDQDFRNRGRLLELKQAEVMTWNFWYAEYPNNYAGDPAGASPAIGEALIGLLARRAARAIRVIKDDELTLQLQREFFAGGESHT